jgi:uncharacterized alpha-E superfamily protein
MLSRVAESIHWMSSYIERAENVARIVEVNLQLIPDLPPEAIRVQWDALVNTTGDRDYFDEHYGAATARNVIDFLTFDTNYPNAILSCISAARENARMVRDVISTEMWQQLNTFYLLVQDAARQGRSAAASHEFFERVRQASQLFVGIAGSTMSHGEAWHFCRLARTLERADKTTRILDVKFLALLPQATYAGTPLDDIQWAAVLNSASGLQMYRQRYGRVEPDQIVRFLLLDREFPRSVQYCLIAADESLHAISGTTSGTFCNLPEQRLGQLRSEVAFTDAAGILQRGVHEYLDDLQTRLNALGGAIQETFFSIVPGLAATGGHAFEAGSQQ